MKKLIYKQTVALLIALVGLLLVGKIPYAPGVIAYGFCIATTLIASRADARLSLGLVMGLWITSVAFMAGIIVAMIRFDWPWQIGFILCIQTFIVVCCISALVVSIILLVAHYQVVKEKRRLMKEDGELTRELAACKNDFFYRSAPPNFGKLEDRLNEVRARLVELDKVKKH